MNPVPAAGGLALTLSGGGLRATLFHLGVIRRLAAAGRLKDVRAIFAVSGGAILAAHLRLNWERYTNSDPAEFEKAARDVFDLCERDLRGRVVRRAALCLLLLAPWIRRLIGLLPFLGRFNLWGTAPVHFLIHEYDRFYRGAKLPPFAPGAPSVHLLATSLNTGEICVYQNDRFLIRRTHPVSVPAQRMATAVGVAASSAYPALFRPLEMKSEWLVVPKGTFPETHYLSDGGLFDNLGVVELTEFEKQSGGRFDEVIVSDAGAAMSAEVGVTRWGLFQRGIRTTDILMNRMSEAAHLRMADDKRFRKLSIHTTVPGTAVDENTQSTIGQVRTDLDFFTRRERAMIANHGYQVAGMELFSGQAADPPAWLESGSRTPVEPRPLHGSQSPNLWGLLHPRDWCTWAVLAVTFSWTMLAVYAASYPLMRRTYSEYTHTTFIQQTAIASQLKREGSEDMSRFRMREFWDVPRPPGLGPLGILGLHRLTRVHQAVCERFGWLPGPFPRLEQPQLVAARSSGLVPYMHALGEVWSAGLPAQFERFRDESYLQIIQITDALADGAGGPFDAELSAKFHAYYWGRLLPVESQFQVKGDQSVESAMVVLRDILENWRTNGRLSLGGRDVLAAVRDQLRMRIMKELSVGRGSNPLQ